MSGGSGSPTRPCRREHLNADELSRRGCPNAARAHSRAGFVTEAASPGLMDEAGGERSTLLVLLAATSARPEFNNIITAAWTVELDPAGLTLPRQRSRQGPPPCDTVRRPGRRTLGRPHAAILTATSCFSKVQQARPRTSTPNTGAGFQAQTSPLRQGPRSSETDPRAEPGAEDPLVHYLGVDTGRDRSAARGRRPRHRWAPRTRRPRHEGSRRQALTTVQRITQLQRSKLSDDILDITLPTPSSPSESPQTDLRKRFADPVQMIMAQASARPRGRHSSSCWPRNLSDERRHGGGAGPLPPAPALAGARAYVVGLAGEAKAAAQGAPRGLRAHRPGGPSPTPWPPA